MEDLRPCDSCLVETDRILAKNSKMALSYHFKWIQQNIFNFENARFQMSLAASGYCDNESGKFQNHRTVEWTGGQSDCLIQKVVHPV